MNKLFLPFESLNGTKKSTILFGWLILIIGIWGVCAFGDTHIFPTPKQVFSGLIDLWNGGLVVHIGSSLWLCLKSVVLSTIISLIICYASPMAFLKPISVFLSKLRFLPMTGISFYISTLIHGAREIQVGILVVFMTTFLVTSLSAMICDIPEEEFDHARTLGCSRWEMLWEVVIKGRLDYVIELIRQNLAIVWMMLVTVESVLAAAGGIGFLIKNNDKVGDSGKVICLQIIIVLIGMLLDFLLTSLRRAIFKYSNF